MNATFIPSTNLNARNCPGSTRGFTIVELIISVAIIFVLITSAAVALRVARRNAARSETISALRQMMMGYSGYSDEHKGKLMPGYVDPSIIGPAQNDLIKQAKGLNGELLTPEDSSSYVWRLAPYLDHAWQTYYSDYRDRSLTSKMSEEFDSDVYGPGTLSNDDFGIASIPSIGLNSIFVGGDDSNGGPSLDGTEPWVWSGTAFELNTTSRVAAVRLSEVKAPSRLIVFAPVQTPDPPSNTLGFNVEFGAPTLRAPYVQMSGSPNSGNVDWSQIQWSLDSAGQVVPDQAADYDELSGHPVDRLGDGKLAVGHLDGSTPVYNLLDFVYLPEPGEGSNVAQLRRSSIMSFWSPFF